LALGDAVPVRVHDGAGAAHDRGGGDAHAVHRDGARAALTVLAATSHHRQRERADPHRFSDTHARLLGPRSPGPDALRARHAIPYVTTPQGVPITSASNGLQGGE